MKSFRKFMISSNEIVLNILKIRLGDLQRWDINEYSLNEIYQYMSKKLIKIN